MELKPEALYREEKKGPAITQVTFDETYHLPDYLPDFFSVILSRGDVRLDESKCGNGHIMVRGVLQFRVLYRTGQGEWKISSLEGEYPFQETLMLEEAGEFDMPQTEVFLEDLTVRMINARKLSPVSICTEKRSFWNCVIAGKNCALCGKKCVCLQINRISASYSGSRHSFLA